MPITREDSKRIWEEVKANFAKLDACPRHEFQPVPRYPDQPSHPMKDYVCRRCGGKIDAIAHSWYEKGYQHATDFISGASA
jgi:hypothetical protein